mmetsp:Transcript_66827/g.155244  ORF Transcript_66827/g.155244 Transcript_66827/m.155244 type:complete len:133 (-) Transcript_66827:58-456(-)
MFSPVHQWDPGGALGAVVGLVGCSAGVLSGGVGAGVSSGGGPGEGVGAGILLGFAPPAHHVAPPHRSQWLLERPHHSEECAVLVQVPHTSLASGAQKQQKSGTSSASASRMMLSAARTCPVCNSTEPLEGPS